MTNIDFNRLGKILDDADAASWELARARQRLDEARREVARIGDGRPPHPVPGVQYPPDPELIADRKSVEVKIPGLEREVEHLERNIEHVRALRARALKHVEASGVALPGHLQGRTL